MEDMIITNVHQGDTFKNYPALCAALGITPKTSDSKNHQLKEMQKYFEWHREGHKYIIDKVYERPVITPQLPQPTPGKRYSFYPYVKPLLLHLLAINNGELIMTRNTLYWYLGLVNPGYHDKHINNKILGKNPSIERIHALDYMNNVSALKLQSILNPVLTSLESDHTIYCGTDYMIFSINDRSHYANHAERMTILELRDQVLEEFECEYLPQIYQKRAEHKYYERLHELYVEQGWYSVEDQLVILADKEIDIKPLPQETAEELKATLNQTLTSYLIDKFNGSHRKHRFAIISETLYQDMLKKYAYSLGLLSTEDYNQLLELYIKLYIQNAPLSENMDIIISKKE